MLYIKVAKIVTETFSAQEKIKLFVKILCLYEMMDVHQIIVVKISWYMYIKSVNSECNMSITPQKNLEERK